MESIVNDTSALKQLGHTQRRMLTALLHHPGGLPVDELMQAAGVTENAVRQHITTLERDGFVVRGDTRPTGRRPQQLYELSRVGRELFPRHYTMLADRVIETIREKYGPEALADLMRELGQQAGADGASRLQSIPPDRMAAELATLMTELGYEAINRRTAEGNPEVVAYNCVFHHLAEQFPEVCQFDLALMEAATGRKVEHTECMVRGGDVCRFCLKNRS